MRRWLLVSVLGLSGLLAPMTAMAQPRPPSGVTAVDHPWDNGTRVDVTWVASPDETQLTGYVVRRKLAASGDFVRVDMVRPTVHSLTVGGLQENTAYLFSVAALGRDNQASSPAVTSSPISPTIQWFDGTRLWFLVTLLLFSGAVVTFILMARRGMAMKVRHISGLDMVDEAVGRATEM